MTPLTEKDCGICRGKIYGTVYRLLFYAITAFCAGFVFTYLVDTRVSEVSAATRELKKDVEYIKKEVDKQGEVQVQILSNIQRMASR